MSEKVRLSQPLRRIALVSLLLCLPGTAHADTTLKHSSSADYGQELSQGVEAVKWVDGRLLAAGTASASGVHRGLLLVYPETLNGAPASPLLWQRLPGNLSSEVFTDLSATAEGLYAAGRSWTDDNHAWSLLVKFASPDSRDAVWTSVAGGDKYNDGAYHAVLALDEVGTPVVYAAGHDSGKEKSRSAVVAKYDANGALLWKKELTPANAGHRASVLALASDGGFVYAAGYQYKGKKAADYDKAAPNLVLWKLDSGGGVVWTVNETAHKVFLHADQIKDVKMGLSVSDGKLYTAYGKKSGAKANITLLKHGDDGKAIWSYSWTSKTSKGKPEMSLASSVVDGKDRVYVCGWTVYPAAKDGSKDEDGLILEVDKEYGTLMALHERGETKSAERMFAAAPSPGHLFTGGTSRTDDDGGKPGALSAVVDRFEVRSPKKVRIDIRPDDTSNTIILGDPADKGLISVVIFSDGDINAATQINKSSLRFGRSGNEPNWKGSSMKDVDKDGKLDLLCTFKTSFKSNKQSVFLFTPEDEEGLLKGDTMSGEPILGVDAVRVRPSGWAPEPEPAPAPEEDPVAPEPSPEPAPEPEPEPTVQPPLVSQPISEPAPVPAPVPTAEPEPTIEPPLVSEPASEPEEGDTAAETSDPAEPVADPSPTIATSAEDPSSTTSAGASEETSTAPAVSTGSTRDLPAAFLPVSTPSSPIPAAPISTTAVKATAPRPRSEPASESRILVSTESYSEELDRVASASSDQQESASDGERGSGLFQAYFHEGRLALRRGKLQQAIGYLKEAVVQEPDSAEANRYLGLALLQAGDLTGAESYLSKALRLDPSDGIAKEKLAALRARPA